MLDVLVDVLFGDAIEGAPEGVRIHLTIYIKIHKKLP